MTQSDREASSSRLSIKRAANVFKVFLNHASGGTALFWLLSVDLDVRFSAGRRTERP